MNAPGKIDEIWTSRDADLAYRVHDRPIGGILLDAGLIGLADVEAIVRHASGHGLRFGDAAVALGLVKADTLAQALAFQFDYPVVSPGSSLISREVVAAYQSRLPVLDDLRALRNQILLRWLSAEGERHRVIAVVSPGAGEGRSFIAANLAVTFSQMGQRTLLIDADMRNPRQHKLFGLPADTGLSAMLADRMVSGPLHRLTELRDLSVIPCGGLPPNPSDLLARPTFERLLTGFGRSYDVIVVDTPASQQGPEAEMIAARARGCVFVARKNKTDFEAARQFADSLRSVGASLVGSVLIGA